MGEENYINKVVLEEFTELLLEEVEKKVKEKGKRELMVELGVHKK